MCARTARFQNAKTASFRKIRDSGRFAPKRHFHAGRAVPSTFSAMRRAKKFCLPPLPLRVPFRDPTSRMKRMKERERCSCPKRRSSGVPIGLLRYRAYRFRPKSRSPYFLLKARRFASTMKRRMRRRCCRKKKPRGFRQAKRPAGMNFRQTVRATGNRTRVIRRPSVCLPNTA